MNDLQRTVKDALMRCDSIRQESQASVRVPEMLPGQASWI